MFLVRASISFRIAAATLAEVLSRLTLRHWADQVDGFFLHDLLLVR